MSIFGDFLKAVRAKSHDGFIVGGLPSSGSWDGKDFLKARDISLYTDRALAKRAEKVGEVVFQVKDNKSGDVIEDHPVLNVLNYPNDVFEGFKFWELFQSYYDTLGIAYLVVDMGERELFEPKNVKGLNMLIPSYVTEEYDSNGNISHYTYRTGRGTTRYEASQIIKIHNPDPRHPLKPRSLLRSGTQAIKTEVQIGAYHSSVLENGGKVEGVFKFKTPRLTEVQLKELKEQYSKEYADARSSGLPLFLGGDSEYLKTGLTPEELSYLKAKKMTLEDIVILTGVPKPLLSSFDDIQYSNADVAYRIFLRETIRPLLRNLTGALDKVLVETGRTLTFVDPTPENIEEKTKLIETAVKSYIITPNEGRRMLSALTGEELGDVDGGDKILVPFNLIPLGETSVVSSGSKKKDNGDVAEHPLRDSDIRQRYGKIQIKRMDIRETPVKRIVKAYFNEQRDRIIEHLQPAKTHVFRKEGLLDESLNLELEVSLGKEKFLPALKEIVAAAGAEAMELVDYDGDFTVGSDIVSWIDKRTDVFLRQVNATTYEKLKDEFAVSLAEGESRKDLIKRIERVYGDISKARAATIARTEVHNSTQYGTMEGYRQAMMTIKIWVAVGDAATRDAHLHLDGEEKPLDMPFSNGLMFPGDPNGSPEEVINCRCVI